MDGQAINEIKSAINDNPDNISSIIIEPIQGEGGDNHFREAFLRQLRKLANEHEFLLIYDEVQTGIGITGKMWAHEHFEIKPDLMSFGKKTQCCGIFGGLRLEEIENNVFKESSRINSTFGGNLVDMVRFTIYLELIEKENLIVKASENGAYLLSRLNSFQNKYNDLISNVRGRGLFCAFDLPTAGKRDNFITNMEKEGAIILGCGHNSIRFRPHLNISKNEIDQAISMMKNSIINI